MAVLELEFQNFLKESRDLHEKLYPGFVIDENSFIKLASQKWAILSIEEKAGFQVQWNKASDAEVEDDEVQDVPKNVTSCQATLASFDPNWVEDTQKMLADANNVKNSKQRQNLNISDTEMEDLNEHPSTPKLSQQHSQSHFSPFLNFSQKMRRKLIRENPNFSTGKLMSLISEMWKNLPEEEKRTQARDNDMDDIE